MARGTDSFAEWKTLVGNRFGQLSISTRAAEFHGEIRTRSVDQTHVTEIVASPHQVRHSANQIKVDDKKLLKLSLLLEGTALVAQDGRTAALSAGDVAIYETSRPYTLEFTDDVRVLVMIFPRHLIGLPPRLIHQATAARMAGDSGIGTMISPFMRHIATNLDLLDGVGGKRIVHSAIDLVAALLSAELAKTDATTDDHDQAKMDQIRLFIETHLRDQELSSPAIAAAHFISTRKLQYLFQEQGQTVSDYVRERRLERSRLDLIDPALSAVSIQHIALQWGLADPAYFSRLFKATYGITPREYRGF